MMGNEAGDFIEKLRKSLLQNYKKRFKRINGRKRVCS